jgi:hypothetical protein
MTSLLDLRLRLNDEMGVMTDAETAPWTKAQRNAAISEGYADLWRVGVWKDATESMATATDRWQYPLTSIRRLTRMELLDAQSRVLEEPKGIIEPDGYGSGTFQIRLKGPIGSGYTLCVRGWEPYLSEFSADTDEDDIPLEYTRMPLLKAKAILYRQSLSKFARWGESQVISPPMNVSVDALMGLIAAAEREYAELARDVRSQRTRTSVPSRL